MMREQTEPMAADEMATMLVRSTPPPARREAAGAMGFYPAHPVQTSTRVTSGIRRPARPARSEIMTAKKTPIFVPVLDRFWMLYQPLAKVGPLESVFNPCSRSGKMFGPWQLPGGRTLVPCRVGATRKGGDKTAKTRQKPPKHDINQFFRPLSSVIRHPSSGAATGSPGTLAAKFIF